MRRHRKHSSFPVLEPDCMAYLEDLEIRVYFNNNDSSIEYHGYSKPPPGVLDQVRQAIEIWVSNERYGGLSLQDYLNSVFGYKLP